ncbi:MAG TPA: hypothetical protein VNU19_07030 [Candidatus Acidoferrum sp.]|jgi:hypothetical protein|nr:hypothetical protein [Candidatus Acidoferrum sp.]
MKPLVFDLIDEGKCPILFYLNDRIAALTDKPFVYFLSASHWGTLVKEIAAGSGKNIGNHDLKIRHLTVTNSGTDDRAVVNEANRQSAMQNDFQAKKDALRVG